MFMAFKRQESGDEVASADSIPGNAGHKTYTEDS
jgi:hypothetical protein